MLDTDWINEVAQDDFDPASLTPYQWSQQTIVHGYVLPDHFLSISTSGNCTIEIRILSPGATRQEMSRNFFLAFDGTDLHLKPTSIYISGCLPTDIDQVKESDREYVNTMDRRYRTRDHLNNCWQQIWNHYVLSAFEHWRRTRNDHRMAEFALQAATSRLNQCGVPEERLARLGPFGLQKCRKEVIRQVRLEYGRDVDAVNKLEATVGAFPQLTASAKARALRAFTLCAQRYSNVPLPLATDGNHRSEVRGHFGF